ncbi:3615_t:CDS:10 [Cetraspora pellucida]|uniref:3615_t:CDS:1 n=1 Tax=Cetraspora pellucida TaxID=1433469 RepID=A0A9N9I668_9GLOM|nr:3615_t:CDS:10 [Cetraspora pellucida]
MATVAQLKFDNSFWSPNGYGVGIKILYDKLEQGRVENEEIVDFLRERIRIEELYGKQLFDLSKMESYEDGFLRDDGASLRRAFDNVKNECEQLGRAHLQLASSMYEMVLMPLIKYGDEHSKRLKASQDEISSYLKIFNKLANDVERLRKNYESKCQFADEMEEISIRGVEKADSLPVVIGGLAFSENDLRNYLARMREEIPSQQIKFPILGVYNDAYSGKDIAKWLESNYAGARRWREIEIIGQELIDQGFIKLVGMIGNTFSTSPGSYYQFKKKSYDTKENDETFALGSTLSGIVSTITPSQPSEKNARKDADESDDIYRHTARKLDRTRLFLEETMMDHMNCLEKSELDRIKCSKAAFLNYATTFGSVISATQHMSERLLLYNEALKPEQDIQFMIEQYRTGPFIPRVILYRNKYNGSANDQTFGVPLDKKTKKDLKPVPQIVTKILSCIKKGTSCWNETDKRLLWITNVPLTKTHSLRDEINDGGKINMKKLREHDLTTVAGVLKLYFMELPECLLTFELYEPVRILYSISSDDQDENTRITSVANLLITSLPDVNYATLNTFISHLHRLIKSTNADDEYITALSQTLGIILLRPQTETSIFLHDKHPQRLVKDLIVHYETIFKSSNNKFIRHSGSRDSMQSSRSSRSNHTRESSGTITANGVRDGISSVPSSRRESTSTVVPARSNGTNSVISILEKSIQEVNDKLNSSVKENISMESISQAIPNESINRNDESHITSHTNLESETSMQLSRANLAKLNMSMNNDALAYSSNISETSVSVSPSVMSNHSQNGLTNKKNPVASRPSARSSSTKESANTSADGLCRRPEVRRNSRLSRTNSIKARIRNSDPGSSNENRSGEERLSDSEDSPKQRFPTDDDMHQIPIGSNGS